MGKSYLCAVFKALLEFLGRKPNTSAECSDGPSGDCGTNCGDGYGQGNLGAA